MITNHHPLLGIAYTEDEHIQDCGDVEDGKDGQGCQECGLGEGQWTGWSAKPPGKQIFNTEAAPVYIQDILQERAASFIWLEDNIVHQAFHGHVEAVGLDQDLNIKW